MLSRHPHSTLRAVIRPAILSLSTALLSVACDGGKDLPPGPTLTGTVTGTVTNSFTGNPVAGAYVRISAAAVKTGADGRFEVTDVTTGAATLRCTATGFVDVETAITVTSGNLTHDIRLTPGEVVEFAFDSGFGEFALYVPPEVAATRGLIIAVGGPDTRGFASGQPMGAPNPEVEASLQALGQAFRTLASTRGLAVLGTSWTNASWTTSPDDPVNDQILLDAVEAAARRSGHPELATAPVLMYGMSGGAPEASAFTARNPERVAGLFLKVPSAVSSLTSGDALRIPTYMVLAELDAFVDNAALTAAFEGKRGAGALWALAEEHGVPHHSLTPAQRQVTINWISTILELRLPATPSDPLREIAETSGWLGNRATGEAAPWATYPGDRASASWLPSETTAKEWETFVAASGS